MNIHPIRNDDDHRSALREIDRLWNAKPDTEEGDKLDVLVTLVEKYEETRWPIKTPKRWDPIDVLNYLIEEGGHTQAELAEILGSRSRASEVLARKRALTVEMVRAISTEWKVPAELLIRPLRTRVAA